MIRCNFLQSLKKFCEGGFRATLNFEYLRWLLTPFASYHADYNSIIKTGGSPSSFLSHKRLKLKLGVFLAGHIVAMVTYCATKLTATCSPMMGQFVKP